MLLNSNGLNFSKDIIEIFNNIKINYILSSIERRCVDTVLPISKDRKIKIQTYNKKEFIKLIPLKFALANEESVTIICYRIEEINHILTELKLENFTEENRNCSYREIIYLKIKNDVVEEKKIITTNYKK
ncbi:hypothetical protein [Flavobacterium sp.]|uniref:hypothetical protein n=1 Tax=Flavobacterium sp. TaxID=239 RepID=UPI0038CFC8F0